MIRQKNQDRLRVLQKATRQACDKYKESRKKANKIIRKNKKAYLKTEIENIEQLSNQNDNRKFYQAVKKMNKGFQPRLDICKSKDGNILGETQEIMNRWHEHFEEVYNDNRDIETERIQYSTAEIEVEPPDLIDIEIAIKKQKNNRAPGEDQIVAELIKAGGQSIVRVIHKLIVSVWNKEEMPKDWNTGLICPIFKKGDKQECKNYRAITLLNIVYKILSNIIMERINQYAENILEEFQCGFRCGRSSIEQIFILRQVMEKCFEFNTDLHILFVDYKQAFDSVNRVELLNIMEGYGIPKKLIRLVDMTMRDSNARITIAGNVSNALNITQGVRQGDGLSGVLFNLALNKALEELKLKGNILNKSKQACVYADDIALIARNLPALQEMLTTLTETGKNVASV